MKPIDAEPIIKNLSAMQTQMGYDAISIDGIVKALREAEEIAKVGRWEPTDMGGGEPDEAYVCSCCGEPWVLCEGTPDENNMNYCPNCGARMIEEET